VGRPPSSRAAKAGGPGQLVQQAGKAAFFLFLYLEVLDASFSFDGVIGAFAITSDPIVTAIGLGIGAMYIRSLTIYLVNKGTLGDYVYLTHGAHWAIGALAALLLVSMKHEVPEVVTGLIGVGFIAAAFGSSLVRNRRTVSELAPATVEWEWVTSRTRRHTSSRCNAGIPTPFRPFRWGCEAALVRSGRSRYILAMVARDAGPATHNA
jgi:hypothetical protein